MAETIEREDLISTLHAAKIAGRPDYARTLALEWLTAWPGDTEVVLELADQEMRAGNSGVATDRLLRLIEIDPECDQAYDLLAQVYLTTGDSLRGPLYSACAQAIRGQLPDPASAPAWVVAVGRAYQALSGEDAVAALAEAREALVASPSMPLATLAAAKASLAGGATAEAVEFARSGITRWRSCLAFRLICAEAALSSDRRSDAVESIHSVAAADPLGIVAESLFGLNHPYRDLWPKRMEAQIADPVPAEVTDLLGATPKTVEAPVPTPQPGEAFQGPNPGDPAKVVAAAETLALVRNEFDRLADRLNVRPQSVKKDARLPAYIVVTSHTRMVQELGESSYKRVNEAMMNLIEAVRRKRGWSAYRFIIDDPRSLQSFGLLPCDPGNAWQIKLRLSDLDRALAERGEMIGAVLIVGGHEIVPFHLLPNPTEDDDDFVPSDNPYATMDENYFAPEWPVGRLPSDSDPDLLVKMLRSAADFHKGARHSSGVKFGVWLRDLFGRFFRPQPMAIGYSASIWRKASLAVFRAIGTPRSLIISPPTTAGNMPSVVSRPSPISYFNLHGLEDSPEWYGQRDPLRDVSGEVEFPIALRPEDVVNSGRAPQVVFTEACYGAHVIEKTVETALSLKFLSSGSRAVVGSTKISYGSVTPPLIAADLLGKLFWDELRQSVPVGEALRQAKLKLASEMHGIQGFLDGEDQKTIISFVLYGDPLYASGLTAGGRARRAKAVSRSVERPSAMKTACALGGPNLMTEDAAAPLFDRVHSIVAQYLPTMADAECSLRNQHGGCDREDHCCPTQQIGMKSVEEDEVFVVTLSKQVEDGAIVHPHYARMTLDKGGKVIKLAVSR